MKPEMGTAVEAVEEKGKIPEPQTVILDERAIQNIEQNVLMSEALVTRLLEKGIDYGQTPGTHGMGLWDSGASKIMAAFNCYPKHNVLYHVEEESLTSWCLEVYLISRVTQTIVGSGVGASSTRETKYKYRWEENPKQYGYNDAEIAKMKVKDRKYRMPNPEHGELVNTLFQMAAKRGAVDAARGMPGVGSALKKLFETEGGIRSKRPPIDWPAFWGRCNQMGITEAQVHKLLEVASVQNWIDNGGTLDSAITKIVNGLALQGSSPAGKPRVKRDPAVVKQEELKTTTDLQRLAYDCFDMQGNDVWRELGYSSLRDYEENMIATIKDNPAAINNKLWDSFMAIWKSSRP